MNTLTLSETKSQSRLTRPSAAAPIYQAMRTLQDAANRSTLDPLLLDLVKLRASQLNGCAFCIDMHVRDAEQKGEKSHRLHLLNAWQEVDVYSARERAALCWTEALTQLAGSSGVSDAVFAEVHAEFSEEELLELTLAIIAINGWNRLNVGFRVPPALE
jgi:AhpD family alkylhydroperoxidase